MSYRYDPELEPLLAFLPDGGATDFSDPLVSREGFKSLVEAMNAELDLQGLTIEDTSIPGPAENQTLPLRIYRPEDLEGSVPALLHIHGGGFVIGDLETEKGICVSLCRKLGIVVVSVDYRLAPETPYPGGLEDCYSALSWMHDNVSDLNIDPERIGLFGQSAGGGLAAATALLNRDRNGPGICFQYLGIPELDDRLETPSMLQFTDTPMWNRPNAEYSWDFYLGENYRRGAETVPYLAAPARAEDLSGLPPAYISTMEFDPLRDEGVQYALKLMQAGVPTELHSYPGTFHGSSMFAHAEISQREAAETLAVLSRGLGLKQTATTETT